MMRKTFAAGLALAALAFAGGAQAQGYPSKPIKIVVPFAVGGIADTFGRSIAAKLSEAWGQPVVVENKGGAGGNIGADLVAKSAPDGYTLVMGNIGTHAINQYLMKSMPYDTMRDFIPIAHVLDADNLLVVHPSVPAKTVPELIAYAKSQPGKLSYASGGMGTTSHLAGELFKSTAGVDLVHVPYKGNSPAITVIQHAKAGKLRPIATLGSERNRTTPDYPAMNESIPGYQVSNWIGLFAPAGTPPEIVNRLNAEVQKIMRSPEIEKRLETEGAKFVPTTPQSFAAFQKAEADKWAEAIRKAGIKAE
jgi:tripartite-type tricarboxylate transporter receptor subunit TctC